jgi:two-component system, NarL family, nitrate/nitrite response regulator NarL
MYVRPAGSCLTSKTKMMVLLGTRCNKIRNRWRQALTGSYPIHELGDRVALAQALAQHKPAVLLLDSDAIYHRGIRHLKNLLQASPQTRIIFFTNHITDNEAIVILNAGASGYCRKDIPAAAIRKAVNVVSVGEIWAERRLISLFIRSAISSRGGRKEVLRTYDAAAQSADAAGVLLSPRERDVASMIAIGEQNKSISSRLSISEKTVKAHLTNIFKKLGVSTRTQLALFVRHNEFSLNESSSIDTSNIARSQLN